MDRADKLTRKIQTLIGSRSEGDYWDFKEFHHDNKANLLHDIICMANNLTDEDGLIIFGVQDGTYKVAGCESDPNRRNLNSFVNFLKGKKFVGGIRPQIELYTIFLEGHGLDVLLIKNDKMTPYFLVESFRDLNREVRAFHIYTRVGDANTDIDKSADLNHMEHLWRKRLGASPRVPKLNLAFANDDGSNAVLSVKYTPPLNTIYYRPIGEDELESEVYVIDLNGSKKRISSMEGVTVGDIRAYNEALPPESEIREYNLKNELYQNAQHNCLDYFLCVSNTGTALANTIAVKLLFPPEVLVYPDWKIGDIKKPKMPAMPENPFDKILEKRYQKIFNSMGGWFAQQEIFGASRYDTAAYHVPEPLRISIEAHTPGYYRRDYDADSDHSVLTLHIDKLLHTQEYLSDKFSLIISRPGEHHIRYSIVCADLEEPVWGDIIIIAEH